MRSLALSAALLIVLLCLAEAALRTNYVFGALPMPRPYYTFDVTRRLHHYDALLRERGPVDVLFVGSSAVRAGFRPPIFDATVRNAGGGELLSFNGGLSKMFPPSARLYLEHVWLARANPRFVLHGIRPVEVMTTPDHSPKFLRRGTIENLWLEPSEMSKLEAQLIAKSKLLQYRGTLNTALTRLSGGEPLHAPVEVGEQLSDSTGFRAEPGDLHRLLKIKADDQRRRDKLWIYKVKPQPKRLERGLRVLKAIHRRCETAGVQYVLVHLPEHPNRFDHKHGPPTWKLYQKMVKAWAKAHDVPFIDITRGDYQRFADDDYYRDYHHLSPRGAEVLSELVAKDFAELLKADGEVRRR